MSPYREQSPPPPHRCTRWRQTCRAPMPHCTFWVCVTCEAIAPLWRQFWLDATEYR